MEAQTEKKERKDKGRVQLGYQQRQQLRRVLIGEAVYKRKKEVVPSQEKGCGWGGFGVRNGKRG